MNLNPTAKEQLEMQVLAAQKRELDRQDLHRRLGMDENGHIPTPNVWPHAWTLAAALFAGNVIRNALEPASGPVEPTQVVGARVIRDEPTEAPKALPGSRRLALTQVLLGLILAVLVLLLIV